MPVLADGAPTLAAALALDGKRQVLRDALARLHEDGRVATTTRSSAARLSRET